jgi:hypothetical protein
VLYEDDVLRLVEERTGLSREELLKIEEDRRKVLPKRNGELRGGRPSGT